MAKGATVVYPLDDNFLEGIPAAPITADSATADRLVATGAFVAKSPAGEQPEPVELTEAQLARLDFYHNEEPAQPSSQAASPEPAPAPTPTPAEEVAPS